MINPLIWFLSLEIIGILLFPLVFIIFVNLPDRGYSICKIFFLLLTGYLIWISGLTHIIPNSFLSISALILLTIGSSIFIFLRKRCQIISFLKSEWPVLLALDFLFLVVFMIWITIASQHPDISHTEKPMDFGFLNAIFSSKYFPPEDPWFSGYPISYYYFGHLIMATFAKVTLTSPAIAYNLSISLIPALLAIGSYGLLYNLIRLSNASRKISIAYSLIGPALLLLMSNLQGPLELAHAQGWGSSGFWDWAQIKGLEGIHDSLTSFYPNDTWWWWRSTRVIDTLVEGASIDYTITEFPLFSFILGDLHPHVLSLPFLILFLSLMANMFFSSYESRGRWLTQNPLGFGVTALILGSISFINFWDAPTYLLLFVLFAFAKALSEVPKEPSETLLLPKINAIRTAINSTISQCFPILILSVLLFLPFYLDLHGQVGGISPYYGPGTRVFHFLIVMGVPVLLSSSFLIHKLPIRAIFSWENRTITISIILVSITPLVLWLFLKIFLSNENALFVQPHTNSVKPLIIALPCVVIMFLAITSSLKLYKMPSDQVTSYLLIILGVGFLLLMGSELYYLLDSFGNRMNTVFKTYYQAWILLMLVGSYGIYYLQSNKPKKLVPFLANKLWISLIILIFAISLYYPIGAISERKMDAHSPMISGPLNLDGLRFIEKSDPGEYEAINWLLDQRIEGPLLEAIGEDYSDYGRISSSTGIPTVLGWKGHELQWRGSSGTILEREADVAEIYQTIDSLRFKYLLNKYDIKYIYVGIREKNRYREINLKYQAYLQDVFNSNSVTIYKVLPNKDLQRRYN